ncbi:ATP-binding protein [Halanaerobium sp. ST460_2HS_T2]|uniref:ATP-binding protein n=1 Tax=Halanaerobium sp. ST460_2HS_T2 TaxID=2183914 RepID=UPI000DF2BE30|nr:ATP-binding protein [Halanaerobium sp. ST460_2HS_T2]RCW60293.1 serine/threonine-protein kinase RsbW [Halanaerobium sp. ST460_2HS_T2]
MQKPELEEKFKIGCKAAEISQLIEKIFMVIEGSSISAEELKFNLEIAAREMLANAIEHGCALAAEKSSRTEKMGIKVMLKVSGKTLKLTVEDPGPGFDWVKYDLETMPVFEEKGRGLKMIYQVSDQLKFNSTGNEITAIFKV